MGDPSDPSALLFPRDPEQYVLKLSYDKQHAISNAVAGPNLDNVKLTALKAQLQRDLDNIAIVRTANWVLFANVPVIGAHRYRRFPDFARSGSCTTYAF